MRTKTTAFLLIILVLLYTFIPFGSAVHQALIVNRHRLPSEVQRMAESPRFISILKLVRLHLGEFYYETRPEEWKKFVLEHLTYIEDAEIVDGIKDIFEQEYFPNRKKLKQTVRKLWRKRQYATVVL